MAKFRKAEKFDLPRIEALVNSAYRGDYAKKGWTTEAYILDGQRTDQGKLQELITNQGSEILIALDEETEAIVGCVNVIREHDALYFGMLTVEPDQQGKGLGKQLLRQIEKIAQKLGLTRIKMTVIHGRPELVSYYERFGYKRTGKTEPFPNDPRYGIPRKENLFFEEFVKMLSE